MFVFLLALLSIKDCNQIAKIFMQPEDESEIQSCKEKKNCASSQLDNFQNH